MKPVLSNRLYVPLKQVSKELEAVLYDKFSWVEEIRITPDMCKACYMENEGESLCENGLATCPHRFKTHLMFDTFKKEGEYILGIWRGDLKKLKKYVDLKYIDCRSYNRAQNRLKFLGFLRSYQIEAVHDWVFNGGSGQIEAPARSGKTVLGTYIATKLRFKTLILVHQKELAQQFYETFQALTNEPEIKNVVIAKDGNLLKCVEEGYDIILSTYQTFISKAGQARLKQVQNYFGTLIVDECHLGSAPLFNLVCNTLNTRFRLGLTATPDRKDSKHILGSHALGPVLAKVAPPQLVGKASFLYTGYNCGSFSNWATMLNRVSKSKTRNKLIVHYIKEDYNKGHYLLVVTERVAHCDELQSMLKEVGLDSLVYNGKTKNRNELLNELKAGKHRITIATRKVVQYGLNVPPWSSYHCCSPTNNKFNYYQEMSRVRTPDPNKKEILCRYYVDSFGAANACASTCIKVCKDQGFTVTKESSDGVKLERKKKEKTVKTANNKSITVWNKFASL